MVRSVDLSKRHEYQQENGAVAYFFGNTTIIAIPWHDDEGVLHLTPLRGDQVGCGEWYDLTKAEVAEYCVLLENQIRSEEA